MEMYEREGMKIHEKGRKNMGITYEEKILNEMYKELVYISTYI